MIDPNFFHELLRQRRGQATTDEPQIEEISRLSRRCGCLLLDVSGGAAWEEAEPVLVPIISTTFSIYLHNTNATNVTGRYPGSEPGYFTCLYPKSIFENLACLTNVKSSSWLPVNTLVERVQARLQHLPAGDKVRLFPNETEDIYNVSRSTFCENVGRNVSVMRSAAQYDTHRTRFEFERGSILNFQAIRADGENDWPL